MHKGQEGKNVRACYEFVDDPMKIICSKLKTKMKVDLELTY
jgi:hypothetical protein